jgi:hypothetical protein
MFHYNDVQGLKDFIVEISTILKNSMKFISPGIY